MILVLLVGTGIYFLLPLLRRVQPQTLTYWGLWESDSVIRPILDDFQAAHPGIQVDYQMQSLTEYRERLQTALSSGRGPDVFRLHNSWVPMFRDNLSPLPADVYSSADFESVFYPAVKDTLRAGTNYMAVPLEIDGLAMFVNDELFLQNNLSVPTGWDELRDTAIAISRCETPDGTCQPGSRVLIAGAALGTTDNIDHWQDIISLLMLQNNVSLAAPSGKPAEDVIEYYSNFSRALGIWDPTLPSSTQFFAQGKVGVYFGPSWRVFDIQALNPSLKFSLHPLPQLPLDSARGEQPVTWASFWVEGVNSHSQQSQAAWELLKYLSSPDVMSRLYQLEVEAGRVFGEPFSRRDLADSLANHPQVGPYITQAPYSRSWYLASSTQDGQTGINTQLSEAFALAVNRQISVSQLTSEIAKILSQYGLAAPLPGP